MEETREIEKDSFQGWGGERERERDEGDNGGGRGWRLG